MKTKVVLIPVDYNNSRKVCEHIEGVTFNSTSALVKYLIKELIDSHDEKIDTGVLMYELTDFMDAVNNQELDVLTNYFMSYVHIK